MSTPSEKTTSVPPLGSFAQNLRFDLIAGFLVFLIALPLCLGISVASGFPPINGVFTAIAGGMIASLITNSQLTIKGPAAGMIAIVMGAVQDFADAAKVESLDAANADVYLKYLPAVAAVAVAAGVIQVLLGLAKAGTIAEIFPASVIHGLLASIGLIIIGKQVYVLLGLAPNTSKEAFEAYTLLPAHISHFSWQVATIGVGSLAFLFAFPHLKKAIPVLKSVPPQLVILAVAIPVGMFLLSDLKDGRTYEIVHEGHEHIEKVKSVLVKVPSEPSKIPQSFIYPDFSAVKTLLFWKWVLMFTLVGTLESLLSAKAVDVLDPWHRRSDLNRDLVAVGAANAAVGCVGGLPMISEIIRSSANKDFGARTRTSNFVHGFMLLLSIIALPFLLNKIPLAALAAMLIYAGCRLAHFKEFVHTYRIGADQLIIFAGTIVGVLATDLLIGVFIGMLVKMLLILMEGVPITGILFPKTTLETSGPIPVLHINDYATALSWLGLKKKILNGANEKGLIIDVSHAKYLDHTSMTRLYETVGDFSSQGKELTIRGLEYLQASSNSLAASRRAKTIESH